MPAPTKTEHPGSVQPLPRLAHARSCQCWLCQSDLEQVDVDQALSKADSEEEGETDEDIDFARQLAAEWINARAKETDRG